MPETCGSRLEELRAALDEIDGRFLDIIRERMALCVRIAESKRKDGTAMMQPDRINLVHERAEAFAAAHEIDVGFVHRLYDMIIRESCLVEQRVMGGPTGDNGQSVLSQLALRIDHVAIAVHDLEPAVQMLRDRYGFEVIERRRVQGEISGMFSATLRAGGVTLVLCQGDSPRSNVSRYIEAYGPGVQHLAIEVSGSQHLVIDDLVRRNADLLTKVLQSPGLDQTFTRRDPNTGMQFEFVTRTTNTGFDDNNVRELFTAMERENVF